MSRFWKLIVSMVSMSITTIVFPIAPAQAQTRAELNSRLTTIEDKFDRMIELQAGQADRWDTMEKEMVRTQQRLTHLESENRQLKQRLAEQAATLARRHAPTVNDRRAASVSPAYLPSQHSYSPRGEAVLIFLNGKSYRNVLQPDGAWLLQQVTASRSANPT
ncbi:MAG: hypothetical protein JSS49_08435 [Planctomycetes bacterium]|nr:hypothetical protein [Planctomycetota bacterium]